ncbi:MAG TPA: hypothetical protein VGM98_22795, partial [Schlesneria sp.]
HPFMAPNWHRLSQTPSGRELFPDLLSSNLVREVGVFRQSFVSAAKLLWKLLPQRTTMWRRIDTALGQVLSIHLLHQRMLRTPDSGDPEFQLTDCTPA